MPKDYIVHADFGEGESHPCIIISEVLPNNKIKVINIFRDNAAREFEKKMTEVDKRWYIDILRANTNLKMSEKGGTKDAKK